MHDHKRHMEFFRWELIVGDVFHIKVFETFCATITGMEIVTIRFIFLVSRGMLLIGMVLQYLFFLKIVACYMAPSMCKTKSQKISKDSKGWILVS